MSLVKNKIGYWVYEPDPVTGERKLVYKERDRGYLPDVGDLTAAAGVSAVRGPQGGGGAAQTARRSDGTLVGDADGVPGTAGWNRVISNAQRYFTANELGQKVVNTANVLNADGTAHKAYQAAPGTELAKLIQRKQSGDVLTSAEEAKVRQFWASNPTQGLASVNGLGGNHNGYVTTKKDANIGRSLA